MADEKKPLPVEEAIDGDRYLKPNSQGVVSLNRINR